MQFGEEPASATFRLLDSRDRGLRGAVRVPKVHFADDRIAASVQRRG